MNCGADGPVYSHSNGVYSFLIDIMAYGMDNREQLELILRIL